MHVLDLTVAQQVAGRSSPTVFETLSPSFAQRLERAGVCCESTAGLPKTSILPSLRRLLVAEHFDVVHAHAYDATWWSLAALSTLTLSGRQRPKFVVTCHGWIKTSVRLRVLTAFDRLATRAADGIVVVSDELLPSALILARRATAIACVVNGVPARPLADGTGARRRLGLPEEVPLVGAIGRLAREKRHDVFIEACARIAVSRPDVHFVLAGGGPQRAALAEHADRLRLSSRFHMCGVVDDVDGLLSQLDVVVQSSDIETTSRIVLEAMVQARPIIATRVGGTENLLRHGVDGLIVSRRAPQEIATAVLALLADRSVAVRLGASARARATELFTADSMAAGVDDVYAAVLTGIGERYTTWVRRGAERLPQLWQRSL
jgi:glycosyltransferase involved in cell wall biosynthesis